MIGIDIEIRNVVVSEPNPRRSAWRTFSAYGQSSSISFKQRCGSSKLKCKGFPNAIPFYSMTRLVHYSALRGTWYALQDFSGSV